MINRANGARKHVKNRNGETTFVIELVRGGGGVIGNFRRGKESQSGKPLR